MKITVVLAFFIGLYNGVAASLCWTGGAVTVVYGHNIRIILSLCFIFIVGVCCWELWEMEWV